LWPNSWMHHDISWYGGRRQPRRRCFRWGPSCSFDFVLDRDPVPQKSDTASHTQFSASVYCDQTAVPRCHLVLSSLQLSTLQPKIITYLKAPHRRLTHGGASSPISWGGTTSLRQAVSRRTVVVGFVITWHIYLKFILKMYTRKNRQNMGKCPRNIWP